MVLVDVKNYWVELVVDDDYNDVNDELDGLDYLSYVTHEHVMELLIIDVDADDVVMV